MTRFVFLQAAAVIFLGSFSISAAMQPDGPPDVRKEHNEAKRRAGPLKLNLTQAQLDDIKDAKIKREWLRQN